MTIYIDVLFTINFIINYILLLVTGKIAGQSTSALRLFAAALVGAIYAVCMFFPQIKALYTAAAKIAVSCILVATAFTICKPHVFFKTVAVFYITSFIFGGVSLGIFYFTNAGNGSMVSNGIFYYNLSLRTLIISTATAYGVIRGIWKIYKSDRVRDYIKIRIYLNGKNIRLNALVDTGNMLSDPLTNSPVVIAEFEKLKHILPSDFNSIFIKNPTSPESIILSENLADMTSKLRIIPYSAIGAEDSILLGFKPDAVEIKKQVTDDIIIGIYGNRLSKSRDYDALLNPEIISGGIL